MSEKKPVEEMSVAELRAELSDLGSYSHDYDDRREDGEIQHGRPLREREACGASGWFELPIGVPGSIKRVRRLVREGLGFESDTRPFRKDELQHMVWKIRSKIEEQENDE